MPPPAANRHPPLTGYRLVLATLSLALATFMNVLDTTIANVSIPTIAGNLSVSPHQGTWVITSYAVTTAIIVPLTGWLAKRFGEVRLFVVCTTLFSFTSWLCGFAGTFELLVILRALQGAVAGPMIPLSQSLLLRSYPAEKKGMALAFWSMTTVVAPIIGPILGGYLTDNVGWSWIFYINVPVGVISATGTWLLLRKRESEVSKMPIDIVGLSLLMVGVGAIQILLDRGEDLDWFDSPLIWELGIIAAVGLIFFLVWELYERYPVVDLTLFKIRNFTVANLGISMGYMTFFTTGVITPLWLQTQMGYTATLAGLAAAPIGLLTIILTPMVGKILHKADLRLLATIGFMVFGLTCFWQAGFNTNVTILGVAAPRLLQGIGISFFFLPITTLSIAGLPPERIASAAGLMNFSRILAGGFGTSLSVSLWDGRITYHHSMLAENINPYNPIAMSALERMRDSGMPREAALRVLDFSITKQAAMLATNDIFYLSGMMFFLLIGIIWLAERGTPVAGSHSVASE